MNRKEFINSTLAVTAGLTVSPSLLSSCVSPKDSYDFPDLFSFRKVGGFKHIVVEHDLPGAGNEKACAQSSIDYLKSIKF
jgi:hypothetical protein